ncbi:MAG TPA: hypothetical protein GXX28_01985 [Firmicutes bacterium]|nr:hypothetical protein [Bacillota bacterium]
MDASRSLGSSLRLWFAACLTPALTLALTLSLTLLLAVSAASAGEAETPRTPATLDAQEVVRLMLAAQSGLEDFSARVVLHAKIGTVSLPTLTGRLYSKRPNQVKVQMGGVSFLPRHPFLFPDPLEFVSGRYRLALVGPETLGGDETWVVDVLPADPQDKLRMRFWISRRTWLIVQSDMALPGAGRTVMRARYVRGGDRAWVPAELSGQGGLLLLDLLPAIGLGQILNGLSLTEKITFQAELSEHRVNAGLSDAFFAGAGARSASGRQSQQ